MTDAISKARKLANAYANIEIALRNLYVLVKDNPHGTRVLLADIEEAKERKILWRQRCEEEDIGRASESD
jgi:hypothetical protein